MFASQNKAQESIEEIHSSSLGFVEQPSALASKPLADIKNIVQIDKKDKKESLEKRDKKEDPEKVGKSSVAHLDVHEAVSDLQRLSSSTPPPPSNLGSMLHPRTFQNHKITEKYKKAHGSHTFKINTNCTEFAGDANCFATYKFKRITESQNTDCARKVAYMCRFCPTIRWFPETSMTHHLLFGHGVLTSKILCNPDPTHVTTSSPSPRQVKDVANGQFIDTSAKCSYCGEWQLLTVGAQPPGMELCAKSSLNNDNFSRAMHAKDIESSYQNFFLHVIGCNGNGDGQNA